jgi:hypothetical protein
MPSRIEIEPSLLPPDMVNAQTQRARALICTTIRQRRRAPILVGFVDAIPNAESERASSNFAFIGADKCGIA